jgi:hypothetical protein
VAERGGRPGLDDIVIGEVLPERVEDGCCSIKAHPDAFEKESARRTIFTLRADYS